MKKYLLELVVFITGGVVMVLELCGSRLLAPFVGVSIVVWTSLIGIILGSLSLGYFWGGKLADRSGGKRVLALVLFTAAIFVIAILVLQQPVFWMAENFFNDISTKAVFSTIALFVVPNIFLGIVTPLATKLRLETLKTAGGTIGNLYAFSTLGSITGTFLTGFVLLLYFSTTQIIVGLGIILFLLSFLVSTSHLITKCVIILLAGVTGFGFHSSLQTEGKVFESQYNHIHVFTTVDYASGKPIKVLRLDNKWDSAMYVDEDDLVFSYTKYYRMAKQLVPDAKRVLMIGGGGYSVPKDFLRLYPDVTMDVVELDPFLTVLAREEFRLADDPRLSIYHEDGRTFLNREAGKKGKQYDAILIDAFSSYSIPFHLTTKEAIENMRTLLSEDGVIIVNIISAVTGAKGEFLHAAYATYKTVFPEVFVFPVDKRFATTATQNIMLMATNDGKDFRGVEKEFIKHLWLEDIPQKHILTDDFAPVDQYVVKSNI